MLGSLSMQDAFAVRLEIFKSKLSTTETIVQVLMEEDRTRRSTASETDGAQLERTSSALRNLAASNSSNSRLLEKKLVRLCHKWDMRARV